MFAIFGIGAAIVSQVFGLQPKHAAVNETTSTPLEDYSNDDGTASRNVNQPGTRMLTLEVKSHPTRVYAHHSLMFTAATASTFRLSNVQDLTTTNQDSSSSLRSPAHDFVMDLEAASSRSSAIANNNVPEQEHPPKTSRPLRFKLIIAGAILVLGVLPLIVLPGAIMGALTGQIQMGIALSSAVATVVGVFAGCYYYIKRDG